MRGVIVAAGLVIGSVAQLRAQDSGIPVGTKAPTATIETLDGKPAELAQYIGKGPVVLEFWATWCPNCKELEPALLAAQKKYAGSVQFVGVAVSVNESPELVRRYVEKHGVAGVHLYDRKGTAVDAYDVPATSFIVVIDKSGKIVYTGLGGQQNLDAAIKKAL
jgi:thiol-disulfide isomerase/thioredoxin